MLRASKDRLELNGSAPAQRGPGFRETLVVAALAVVLVPVGFVGGFASHELGSVVVDVSIVLYIIALVSYPPVRYVFVATALGADAGSIARDVEAYHVSVTILPPLIRIAGSGHVALEVDPVLVLVVAEVVYALVRAARRH